MEEEEEEERGGGGEGITADTDTFSGARVVTMQTLGASGACHMGALFLKRHYGPWKNGETDKKRVYIPLQSWANHPNIFLSQSIHPSPLPYYSPLTHTLDFPALTSAIAALPPHSIIVLQACAHNPTGCDPTLPQWRALASLCLTGNHFLFIDASYLGFVSGCAHTDAAGVRICAEAGVPLLVAMTYGKCFGLYGERVGALCVVVGSEEVGQRVEGQMKLLAREETGAMPAFGAGVVEMVLRDVGVGGLREVWEEDVRGMARELRWRRGRLRGLLEGMGTNGDWSYVEEQVGLFWYTGFSGKQIELLREKFHVYVQLDGRLSIGGLNSSNIEYVAQSIDAVVTETSVPTLSD
ncbi:MAG: hypothetical protein Q9208_006006 [Pyrenodesmia sp. 3 TL-2023]